MPVVAVVSHDGKQIVGQCTAAQSANCEASEAPTEMQVNVLSCITRAVCYRNDDNDNTMQSAMLMLRHLTPAAAAAAVLPWMP